MHTPFMIHTRVCLCLVSCRRSLEAAALQYVSELERFIEDTS